MTANHVLALDRQSMPDIYSKPIKGIGGFHLPGFMEDKLLQKVTYNLFEDYGAHFPGKSKP